MAIDPRFGGELRRHREAAGFSQRHMARAIPCDHGYLSKIEKGQKWPSGELVAKFDDILRTGGALRALHELAVADGEGDPLDIGRRLLPAAVAADASREALTALRALGRRNDPGGVLAMVTANIGYLDASGARPRAAASLAEYAGWMAQEAGRDDLARHWAGETARRAAAAGDHDLWAYAGVRRAEIVLPHDPSAAAQLAGRIAARTEAAPRVRLAAICCAARAHASVGAEGAYEAAMGQADRLLEGELGEPPAFGPASATGLVTETRGWSLYDLGRPHESVRHLEDALRSLDPGARRARGIIGSRLARAHLEDIKDNTRLERARDVLAITVAAVRHTRSAATYHQLRQMRDDLRRWPAARDLRTDIALALRGTAPGPLTGSACSEGNPAA